MPYHNKLARYDVLCTAWDFDDSLGWRSGEEWARYLELGMWGVRVIETSGKEL